MHKIQNKSQNSTRANRLNLSEAGFSDKESAVYLALLEIGKGSVMEIANLAKVDRTTTYRVLQQFLAIPLAQTLKESKKTSWAALNPRYLVDYISRKKKAVSELFPQLEAIYNLNEEKPRLAYFEGIEGLANITANIIKEVKHRGELLSFSAPGAASGYYPTRRFLELARERTRKQIMSKILISTIEGTPGYEVGEDFKNWRHIKLVDPEKFPFKASFNIWNNKIAIFTVRTHPIGVIIEDKDISTTLRSIFNMVWENIG